MNIQIEGHKLMYHVDELSRWLKGETAAPIYVEMGVISACNHKCSFCAIDFLKEKGSFIRKDVLISTLKDMAEFGVKSIMFSGDGEPLLYKDLPEAVRKAKEFGLDVAITSNGSQFTPEKAKEIMKCLSWIKISVDAGTKESYAKIHGCCQDDFNKLWDNLKFAADYKKKNNFDCRVGCQVLLIKDNIEEVEALIQKAKEAGVDYVALKPYSQHPDSINKQWVDLSRYHKSINDLTRKYSTDEFKVIFRTQTIEEIQKDERDYENCYGINFYTLIDALGNVIPCNLYHEKEDFYYGNINKDKFSDIWKSSRRKKIIERINMAGTENCRKGCRVNFANKYLYNLKHKVIEHINFI